MTVSRKKPDEAALRALNARRLDLSPPWLKRRHAGALAARLLYLCVPTLWW